MTQYGGYLIVSSFESSKALTSCSCMFCSKCSRAFYVVNRGCMELHFDVLAKGERKDANAWSLLAQPSSLKAVSTIAFFL